MEGAVLRLSPDGLYDSFFNSFLVFFLILFFAIVQSSGDAKSLYMSALALFPP
jgi:hypothetical protein